MKHKVTLQAEMGRGTFYWVAEVDADSEDAAVMAAENMFISLIEDGAEWEFTDFATEPA